MRIKLSPLAIQILEVCAGVAAHRLDYSIDGFKETEKLRRLKFIYITLEDDQPTYYATPLGERYLQSLKDEK